MPKRKTMTTRERKRLLAKLKAALPPPITVTPKNPNNAQHVASAQVLQATVNQIYPQLIRDAFFQSTPLMDYLRGSGSAAYRGGKFSNVTFDEADAYIPLHEPGYLCESNPFCAECYS